VVRKYGQFKGTGKVPTNFLRHYYDIHQLLDVEAVQKFIGTPEYLAHKKKRFKSLDQNVAKSGAFTIEDENIRKQFEAEYSLLSRPDFSGQNPRPHPEGPCASLAFFWDNAKPNPRAEINVPKTTKPSSATDT
jgi:hypothetical protein